MSSISSLSSVPSIDPADLRSVVNRIKRAQGQLAGVLRMIEDERDPESVVQQLKAVSGALDRASFAVVAADLKRAVAGGSTLDDGVLEQVEKLFLSLS